MQKLTAQKLEFLCYKFMEKMELENSKETGFSEVEFVKLMKRIIPYEHPREEYDLVHGLVSLFNEIDINGDGSLEWDEFATYLIEVVDTNNMTKVAKDLFSTQGVNIKQKAKLMMANPDINFMMAEENLPKYLHTSNLLQQAQSQKASLFQDSMIFHDKLIHNSPIEKALIY